MESMATRLLVSQGLLYEMEGPGFIVIEQHHNFQFNRDSKRSFFRSSNVDTLN